MTSLPPNLTTPRVPARQASLGEKFQASDAADASEKGAEACSCLKEAPPRPR